MNTCKFDECGREARTKGLCGSHYNQQRAGKELTPLRARSLAVVLEDGRKLCTTCNEYKDQEEGFYGTSSNTCRKCHNEKGKEWQEANAERVPEIQRAWREANEGHTYLDKATGYVVHVGYNHPIANPSGITRYHRIALWDKIGPGEHECYWECGKTLSWDIGYHDDTQRALVVDHLNGDRADNRPENIVPSCQSCNSSVSRASRKVIIECSFEECDWEAASKGLCRAHYQQSYQGKELTPIKRHSTAFKDENGRVCTGCDEYKTWDNYYVRGTGKHQSKCKKCMTEQNNKNTADRVAKGIPCSKGCGEPALNKGLCQKHYHEDWNARKEVAA